MASKKATTETTTVAKKTVTDLSSLGQKDIPGMLDAVNEQIKKIRKGLPETPHTDKPLPGLNRKISELKTVDELIKAGSIVMVREEAYEKSAEKILSPGIKKPTFKLEGITAEKWLEDIMARVVIVANKEELNKLTKIKKKLEENLSAEAKLARDLAEIQTLLIPAEDEDEG